jgi:non-specific serine/threonine protein kinase/serine/threonine-protein kinase
VAVSDDLTRTSHGAPVPGGDRTPLSHIGRYRVLRIIGEGGMGIVYEAEQENPRRIVALKVIRPGFVTADLLRRFEQESQMLGRLQHSGIAQVYEAGTAPSAHGPQPFFAMELVRGRRLDVYAAGENLGIRERLELVARICDAVEHAHQKGIVHRDLKPGNILVDESGQPKILDFGVARATDSDVQATMHTQVGAIVGTLPYMSPEQVGGDPTEMDTRSDVYALGVILFELLSGKLPYDLDKKTLPEAVRVIREEDPTRLTMVSRTFRGDVETIAAKALSKERERRYQSAADLAADIRRYLRDEPIVARPASTAYQLRKFARRNKALVAGVAAVFVVLVIGVVVSSWQAVRATRAERLATSRLAETQEARKLAEARGRESEEARRLAEERRTEAEMQKAEAERARGSETEQRLAAEASAARAKQEAAKAGAVNTFLQDMLSSVDPFQMKGRDVTVRQVLDEAAKKVGDGSLGSQPEIEVAVRGTLGNTYRALGLYPEAEPQLQAALDLRRKNAPGEETLDLASSLNDLALLKWNRGDIDGAERLYREALRIRRKALGNEHPDLWSTLNNLAVLLADRGDGDEAEPLYREALRIRRKALGDEHPDVATTLSNLALLLASRGDLDGAEPLYRESLRIRRKVLGDENPDVAVSLGNLATLLHDRGDLAGAEPLYREAIRIRRKTLGDEHPDVAVGLNTLGVLLFSRGDLDGAEPLYREALQIRRKALGDENPQVALTLYNLALLLRARGDLAGAEPLSREALRIRRKAFGDESPGVADALGSLGSLLVEKGELAEAEPLLRESLTIRTKVLPARHLDIASGQTSLAACLNRQGRYAEAEALLREALSVREEKLPPEHWRLFEVKSLLGEALSGQGKFQEAEPLLLAGYEGIKDNKAVPAQRKRVARERLERLYEAWGKPDQAAAWHAEGVEQTSPQ